MTDTKIGLNTHPTELELADLLERRLSREDRRRIEEHAASCDECLANIVSAYESIGTFKENQNKRKANMMKRINVYLILSITSFILSFVFPKYFVQFLVATLLLGIKWVADAKSTRMLVMIYEAWKKGGEKEASRILETFDTHKKKRF